MMPVAIIPFVYETEDPRLPEGREDRRPKQTCHSN